MIEERVIGVEVVQMEVIKRNKTQA